MEISTSTSLDVKGRMGGPFGLDFVTKYYLHFNDNRKELHFQDVNTFLYLISPFFY